MNSKGKKIKTIIIVILSIVLYSIPIICIKLVSNDEIAEYKSDIKYSFKEKAYGSLVQPVVNEFDEFYNISGIITSENYRKIKLPKQEDEQICLTVKEEDEIYTGQRIGTMGATPIYSSCNGIVEEIVIGEESYINAHTFNKLILQSYVEKSIVKHLKDVMYDEDGNKYTLISKSNQCTDQGIEVKYAMDKTEFSYGEKVENLALYTGKKFTGVLMIEKNCIYQKPGSESYYVRICKQNGVFVEEREVEIGFEYKDYVTVVGIEENEYCDSGYKSVINNQEIPTSEISYNTGENDSESTDN